MTSDIKHELLPPSISEQRFAKEDVDGKLVHFQVLDLGSSMYVWVSSSMAMNNMALAMPMAKFGSPASTQLLPGTGADASERVGKRLALKFKKPVAVSWNVDGDDPLHFWAEKQLSEHLKAYDLTARTKGLAI